VLPRLLAAAVPAAAQAAAARTLVGRWQRQNAELSSEVTFDSDGTFVWHKCSAAASPTAAGAAGGQTDNGGSIAAQPDATAPQQQRQQQQSQQQQSQQQQRQQHGHSETWRGTWRVAGRGAAGVKGQLQLTFVVARTGVAEQQQRQLQALLAFEQSALDDALMLDSLAHVAVGAR
jgi:hypothetical protein